MKFQEGFVYHIKDEYFAKVNDDRLMQNKESGSYRPTFFMQQLRQLIIRGKQVVFPNIQKLEALMLEELHSTTQGNHRI